MRIHRRKISPWNFLIKIVKNGENTGQRVRGRSALVSAAAARITQMEETQLRVLLSLLKAQSVKQAKIFHRLGTLYVLHP